MDIERFSSVGDNKRRDICLLKKISVLNIFCEDLNLVKAQWLIESHKFSDSPCYDFDSLW